MTSPADVGVESISYCQRWNNKLIKPIQPLSPAEALRKDRAQEWYTVVVGDLTAPRCYVEVAWANDHLGVWFLDDELRQSVHISFTRLDDTTMFLDAMGFWYYPGGGDDRWRMPRASRRLCTEGTRSSVGERPTCAGRK